MSWYLKEMVDNINKLTIMRGDIYNETYKKQKNSITWYVSTFS